MNKQRGGRTICLFGRNVIVCKLRRDGSGVEKLGCQLAIAQRIAGRERTHRRIRHAQSRHGALCGACNNAIPDTFVLDLINDVSRGSGRGVELESDDDRTSCGLVEELDGDVRSHHYNTLVEDLVLVVTKALLGGLGEVRLLHEVSVEDLVVSAPGIREEKAGHPFEANTHVLGDGGTEADHATPFASPELGTAALALAKAAEAAGSGHFENFLCRLLTAGAYLTQSKLNVEMKKVAQRWSG